MKQSNRLFSAMRFQLVSIAMSALPLLPCLSSCSSGPSNAQVPSGSKKNLLRVHAPLNFAYATKDAIAEGDDLEIILEVTIPDSSWTVEDPEHKLKGSHIEITPWMTRPRTSSSAVISASRRTTKVIKGLKPGKYKVVVINEGGKNSEINVEVQAKLR